MSQTLSGNLSGQIADMLEGSIAGNISLLSPSANIESKTITENGTYTAPSGVDGYNPITVNVPSPQPVIESKSITENGTYTAPSGVDGYNPITVNVPSQQAVIESKSITANGTYTAPSGVDGYNPITVNVPSKIEGTLIVTENGTFTPEDSNHVWNTAIVNVPSAKIITSNTGKYKLGIVNFDDDNELVLTFSDVTINAVENLDIITNQKLVKGINTNTLKLCKAYDSSAQTNQIGWIGFYQNSIRAWNTELTQNILIEHAYCSLFLSDETESQDNPYIEL